MEENQVEKANPRLSKTGIRVFHDKFVRISLFTMTGLSKEPTKIEECRAFQKP